MDISQALHAINEARTDWLLHRVEEREEKFKRKVMEVLVEYGSPQIESGPLVTQNELRELGFNDRRSERRQN